MAGGYTICTAKTHITHWLHLKGALSFSLVYDLVRFGKHLSRTPKCQKKKEKSERRKTARTIEQQSVQKRLRVRRTLCNPPDLIGCCVKSY